MYYLIIILLKNKYIKWQMYYLFMYLYFDRCGHLV